MLVRLFVLGFLATTIGIASQCVADSTVLGVQDERPASGPYVETDQGFMVPYMQKLPGCDVEFTMIPIPGGVVTVGAGHDAQADDAEHPTSSPRRVRVEPRWVGKYEVTWAEYWRYMELDTAFSQIKQLRNLTSAENPNASEARQVLAKLSALEQAVNAKPDHVDGVTAPTALYDPSTTYESGKEPNLPAVSMSPYAAKQYTKWLSVVTKTEYRLPTEAEWEHAARGNGDGVFGAGPKGAEATSDTHAEYAWTMDNADYTAHPVGQKKPNAWGLYDVLGNAAEWVLDEHQETTDASKNASPIDWRQAVAWPTGPTARIAKGGFWDGGVADSRIASRLVSDQDEWKGSDPNYPKSPWWFADYPSGGVGMRLVRTLKPMDDDLKRRVWEADDAEIKEDVQARLEEGRGKLQKIDAELPKVREQLQDAAIGKLLN